MTTITGTCHGERSGQRGIKTSPSDKTPLKALKILNQQE